MPVIKISTVSLPREAAMPELFTVLALSPVPNSTPSSSVPLLVSIFSSFVIMAAMMRLSECKENSFSFAERQRVGDQRSGIREHLRKFICKGTMNQ